MQGFPLGSYVKLVEYTGRLFRRGKASISGDLAEIFERLGCKLKTGTTECKGSTAIGCWAVSLRPPRAKLREIGERLGVRHLVNLAGCPAR